MKRKFEELRENLDEFVEQTQFPLLVVGCLPNELAYVAKFLQALEETHKECFFVVFVHSFEKPNQYLDGIVENIRLQVEAAAPLREKRGEPPFPPIPSHLTDHSLPPGERLLLVTHYLASLLPNQIEYSVVVGLLPLSCSDFMSYAQLVGPLMPIPEIKPWMAPFRIVAYDDRSQRILTQALKSRKADNVLYYEVDFSTPALANALSVDAANPSVPMIERMACLLQLAALDYSYKRYDDALQKYRVLHEYYSEQKLPSMQALALLGAGDTLRARGELVAAKEMLQRGIALSMQHKILSTLLNLLHSINEVCFQLGEYEEAESYADSGVQVAAAVLNPFANADMFERKADALAAQKKLDNALENYQKCESICEKYDYFHRWKSTLAKQEQIFDKQQKFAENRQARKKLSRIDELESLNANKGKHDTSKDSEMSKGAVS